VNALSPRRDASIAIPVAALIERAREADLVLYPFPQEKGDGLAIGGTMGDANANLWRLLRSREPEIVAHLIDNPRAGLPADVSDDAIAWIQGSRADAGLPLLRFDGSAVSHV